MNDYLGKRQLDMYAHGHLLRWLSDKFADENEWLDAYDAILTFIEDDEESIESLLDRGWPWLLKMAMEVSHG